MAILVSARKEFPVRLDEEHMGHDVPLKDFLQPCEVMLYQARSRPNSGAAVGMEEEKAASARGSR